jgi:hypothetical protein
MLNFKNQKCGALKQKIETFFKSKMRKKGCGDDYKY